MKGIPEPEMTDVLPATTTPADSGGSGSVGFTKARMIITELWTHGSSIPKIEITIYSNKCYIMNQFNLMINIIRLSISVHVQFISILFNFIITHDNIILLNNNNIFNKSIDFFNF